MQPLQIYQYYISNHPVEFQIIGLAEIQLNFLKIKNIQIKNRLTPSYLSTYRLAFPKNKKKKKIDLMLMMNSVFLTYMTWKDFSKVFQDPKQ